MQLLRRRSAVKIFRDGHGTKIYYAYAFRELENDENYFIDYIDCYLFDQSDNRIGKIIDVVPIRDNDVLLVDTNLGQKMAPFAKQLILFFDKDNKKLVMTIHKGMFE